LACNWLLLILKHKKNKGSMGKSGLQRNHVFKICFFMLFVEFLISKIFFLEKYLNRHSSKYWILLFTKLRIVSAETVVSTLAKKNSKNTISTNARR
jgi:hypothetical protein